MDFGSLPPEINSAQMYTGPGSGPMLAAAGAWDGVAAQLISAASSYGSVVSELTDWSWFGSSAASMTGAATPFAAWVGTTAAQAEQAASQARAAAAAYEVALAATVPPPLIAANRAQLASLVATNILGQNAPAIASTEAHYGEMWAQDAAAMYAYAGSSAAASRVTPFTTPPQVANLGGQTAQAAAVAQAAGTSGAMHTHTTLSPVVAEIPQALQGLASPGSSGSSTSGLSSLTSAVGTANTYLSPLNDAASFSRTATSAGSFFNGMVKPASSAARAAAQVVDGGAKALGTGLGSTATGPAGLGAAVSGGLGRATPIGGLSVPPGWTAATQALNPGATAGLSNAGVGAASALEQSGTEALMGGVPAMGPTAGMGPMAGAMARHMGSGILRVGPRPFVMPRSPAAG